MFYFIKDENAQYYECGFSCDNAIVLRLNAERFFITDSRYTTEAKENIRGQAEVITSNDLIGDLLKLLKKHKVKEVIFNDLETNIKDYLRLTEQKDTALIPQSNFHQKLRIIKTPQEIKFIKQSQKLNKKAFKKFAKYINKNLLKDENSLNEAFLHFKSKKFLEDSGNYNLSFNPIIGINATASKPHALPSKDISLKIGDTLLFDAGVKYNRYCSDMTRTASVVDNFKFKKSQNFSNAKYQKIYDTVLFAQENAIKNARSGMSGKQIDALARDIITKAGFGEFFIHNLGHGIGLDIHEMPYISPYEKGENIIEDGMVFSIEPGIYLPDEFGVRIEDLVVMKDGKAIVL